jgi:hypothetical protein
MKKNLVFTLFAFALFFGRYGFAADPPAKLILDKLEVQGKVANTFSVGDHVMLSFNEHVDFAKLVAGISDGSTKIQISGYPIEVVQIVHPTAETNQLEAYLEYSTENENSWNSLLSSRGNSSTVTVSVVGANDLVVGKMVKFVALTGGKEKASWILGIVVLAVLVLLTFTTNILRDSPDGVAKRHVSLSKVQTAIWTAIVLPCWFLVWQATGSYDVPEEVLVLLAVSVTTLAAGSAIPSGKNERSEKRRVELENIKTQIANIPTPTALDTLELNKAKADLKSLDKPPPLSGIVDDGSSVSLSKVQNLLWTGILGLIFVIQTVANKQLPEFDPTLLMLMGLSSGTYVSMKALNVGK